MAMLNIGGDPNDPSYRYKMPKLLTKIEGRGNGIKTVIPNMVDIAKALHTPPSYPTKFFGIELGAQSNFNEKTERAIVNGAHNQPDLAEQLNRFIDQFILCPKCKLPEIKMTVKKQNIKIDCAACGYNNPLKSAHRLVKFILNNPPGSKAGDDEDDKDKKKNRKEKKKKKEEEEAGDDDEDADGDEKEKKKKKKEKKDKKEKKEKKKKKDKKSGSDEEEQPDDEEKKVDGDDNAKDDHDDDDEKSDDDAEKSGKKDKKSRREEEEWATDLSADAVEARRIAEFEEMQSVNKKSLDAIMSAASKDLKSEAPENILKMYFATGRTVQEKASEVRRLQLARGLDDSQKVQVLVKAIIDPAEPKTIPGQFKENAELLKVFAADKLQQSIIISSVEELIGKTYPKLVKLMPHILKALYEADVLEEDALVAWHLSPPESSWLVSKQVAANCRAHAKPFVEWLQEAESESEDDEE